MSKYIYGFFFALLAFFYKCPPSLDLIRYYETANGYDMSLSVIEFATKTFDENFDFIYFSSFFLVRKINFPIEIVSFFYVGFYFFLSIKLTESIAYKLQLNSKLYIHFILLFMLTSVGIYIIFSISRNVAALTFFLLGVLYLLQSKKRHLFFWILAVFTHIGLLIYLVLFVLFYYVIPIPKFKNRKKIILGLIGLFLFFSKYFFLTFDLISTLPFFTSYGRYLDYLNVIIPDDIFSSLGFVETLSYYYFTFILFFGYLFLKEYTKIIWASFGVFLLLIASFGFSIMFLQRSLLFLFPFQGIVAVSFYKENYNKRFTMFFYTIMLLISIILFLGYLYSYRKNQMF